MMKLKFWGVRGSIPSPSLPDDIKWKIVQALKAANNLDLHEIKIENFVDKLPAHITQGIGGNTPCVEVNHKNQLIILDCGSGLRKLGHKICPPKILDKQYIAMFLGSCVQPDICQTNKHISINQNSNIIILLSHTHWDHMQGFPFFTPAYYPGNTIKIYGPGTAKQLAEAFELQQTKPSMFPVSIKDMKADISFHSFPKKGLQLNDLFIDHLPLPHPGGCYSYRLKSDSKSVVYATDFEFNRPFERNAADFLDFINGTDALICDTQYTHLEGFSRDGWGHSTNFGAIDIALKGNVKHLFMFHHDPEHSDMKLLDNLAKCRDYHKMVTEKNTKALKIDLAMEGLEVNV